MTTLRRNITDQPQLSWLTPSYYFLFLGYFFIANWFIQMGFQRTGITWVDPYVIELMARKLIHFDLNLYDKRIMQDFAPPEGIAFQYGPVPAIILMPFLAISDLFKMDLFRDMIIRLPFIIFDFLCVYEVGLILRRQFRLDKRFEFLASFLLLLSPLFFFASVINGKFESMIALFILKSIEKLDEKPLMSGVWMALALASKTYALVAFIPISLLMLTRSSENISFKRFLLFVASTFSTLLIIMGPFLFANVHNVLFAFIESPGRIGIIGHTPMAYLLQLLGISNHLRKAIAGFANFFSLAIVTIYSAFFCWRFRTSRARHLKYILPAAVWFVYIATAKFSWIYYGLVPLVLVCVWDFSQMGNRPPYFFLGLCALLFFVMEYIPESHREVGGSCVYMAAAIASTLYLWHEKKKSGFGFEVQHEAVSGTYRGALERDVVENRE
jgi:hypothetical protein